MCCETFTTKSKAMNHIVRTLRSISNKRCFHAQIGTAMLKNNNYWFMVLAVRLASYGCTWGFVKHLSS